MIKDEHRSPNHRLLGNDRSQDSILQVKKLANLLEQIVSETSRNNQNKSQIFDSCMGQSEELMSLYKKSSEEINLNLHTILLNNSTIQQSTRDKENMY